MRIALKCITPMLAAGAAAVAIGAAPIAAAAPAPAQPATIAAAPTVEAAGWHGGGWYGGGRWGGAWRGGGGPWFHPWGWYPADNELGRGRVVAASTTPTALRGSRREGEH